MASRPPDGRDASDYRGLAMASTAVMELTAPILVGAWVDRRYGSAPWGLVVGAVLGFVGGVSHLILMTRRMDRAERERAERERAKGPPA